jgi:hypothetical protein
MLDKACDSSAVLMIRVAFCTTDVTERYQGERGGRGTIWCVSSTRWPLCRRLDRGSSYGFRVVRHYVWGLNALSGAAVHCSVRVRRLSASHTEGCRL